MLIPDPSTIHTVGEQIESGADVKPAVVSELLLRTAQAWQADREKIAYLESLLLRGRQTAQVPSPPPAPPGLQTRTVASGRIQP
jgi:hypothetical protein